MNYLAYLSKTMTNYVMGDYLIHLLVFQKEKISFDLLFNLLKWKCEDLCVCSL